MSNRPRFSVVILGGNEVKRVLTHDQTATEARATARRFNWISKILDLRAIIVPSGISDVGKKPSKVALPVRNSLPAKLAKRQVIPV